MFKKLNRTSKIRWAVVCVLLLTGFILSGSPNYWLVYPRARREFRSSRSGTPGSYEFVSRGVKYGMTRDEVKAVMEGADDAWFSCKNVSPPWDGTVDLFFFFYGHPWRQPFTSTDRFAFSERFQVYYDVNGHAVKLERSMLTGWGSDVILHLKTKKMEKDH